VIDTKLVGRYEIVSELGRGGMGVVYRARDPLLNREVALKVISSNDLTTEIAERFQREAQLVAQMDHPGIVPIYDLGQQNGSLFFVMPVVEGENLRHQLWAGSLRLGEVLDIGIQVAEALDYSHARGVVHRDIKPENIMVSRQEGGIRVRVMDFGLAHATTESRLTKTGTLVGTVAYLSPEQVTAHTFDGRSDIYSLGTVLYECLAGEPPFSGEVQSILYRIVHEVPQPPRALGAEIREELQDIVLHCLQKDPARRPQKAGQVAEALRRHRASLQTDEFSRSVVLTASRMIQRPAASAFIGREKEFTELQHRLNAAVAGDCQFAVVAGEPGIGKTRLLEELKKLCTVRKIRALYGRFVEQDRAFSYQGFCELIQDHFRARDTGISAGERPDFSDLAPELLSLFPLLTEIPELRAAASGGSRLAAAAAERKAEDRIQIFELLARTLTRIGGGKPLVLILENLHGAEISIEALQYVVRRLGPTPTLVVGSYRQTETDKRHPLIRMLDSFADDPRFVSMTLGPFSPSEHRALIESVAGGAKVSDELARRLRDATEGNPFFTKELVRSLIDSGGIARDDSGAWNFSKATAISSDSLPATIQQAVEKRIERLPEEQRELLSIASVIGKSFDFRDLETLAEEAKTLDESAEQLIRDGMLEEERESRGDRLSFASGIVRDVLYGALSRRRRRSLHRKYAELLEKRYAGRLERVYPDLVHHFSQADVAEKSVEYGLKLAQRSLDAFGADDALRAAKTCLEFLEDEEWEGDPSLEGEARFLAARAQRMAGNADGALREAEAAAKVFEREKLPEKAVAVSLFAAEAAWQERRVEDTRRWVERGIEISAAAGKAGERGKLLSLAATVANLRGEYAKASAYLAEIERQAPSEKPREEAIPQGGRLVVAMANPILTMDPGAYQTTEEHEVIGNVFETLVTTDSRGNLVPNLCERWSLEDGGRTVRLEVRKGVLFSDGTPLTAAAVKASLERSIRASREATPAAFVSIEGVTEHLEGKSAGVSGLRTPSEDRVEIRLTEALPIFPAFLTDGRTSIGIPAAGDASRIVGTGPFQVVQQAPERVLLERNPRYWKEAMARLDVVEFRAGLSASAILSGLKSGELELGRDLLPRDLEAILREPRFRSGIVETPKKNTYFALFNSNTTAGSNFALRQAMAHAVRTQDFVWASLGRFALPATGLLPPGVLSHDAGRRQIHPEREKAVEAIRACGLPLPVKLSAAVHPILLDQYGALTRALFAIWADVGVEVTVVTKAMGEYLNSWHGGPGFDLWIGRWIADYDDPDNFTHTLFHSGNGRLRNYFSSPEADRILEEARREGRPGDREVLYRRFENLLLDSSALVPLFHDVDYRIASPRLRGLQLRSTAPYVNYAEIGKVESPAAEAAAEKFQGTGVLQIPIAGVVRSLEPSLAATAEQAEVLSSIFETLTHATQDARVVPWLASEVVPEAEGMRFRFRLRPAIRFHNGRPVTARDVRHSYERLLANRESEARWFLSPVRGARRILNGEATDLEGFRIFSPSEFVIELEKPMSFFPALISYAATGIVPEGTSRIGGSVRDGAIGSGPFRVVAFDPGRRLELERNPHYWREGYPRSEGIVFRFGLSPQEIREDFVAGRLSLAWDLLPADAEAFRHDPKFASGYRETPRLQTYFIAFNRRRGPMKDVAARQALTNAIDVSAAVRRTLGRLAIPAHGIIPPGLLGHSPTAASRQPAKAGSASDGDGMQTISRESVELLAAIHPVFFGEYAALLEEITRTFREMGYTLRSAGSTMSDYMEARLNETADLIIGRWGADYPDADTFVHGILHSREGFLGRFWGETGVDALIERGRSETDPRARHTVYREIEELIAKEALLLPLFHDQVSCFARPEVEGLTMGLTNPIVAYENLSLRR
jgi:ABC-type transport system substrate-binding protein